MKTLKEKLKDWKHTGEHDMTREELDEAIKLYKEIYSNANKLPFMEIIRTHAIYEEISLRSLKGTDEK